MIDSRCCMCSSEGMSVPQIHFLAQALILALTKPVIRQQIHCNICSQFLRYETCRCGNVLIGVIVSGYRRDTDNDLYMQIIMNVA